MRAFISSNNLITSALVRSHVKINMHFSVRVRKLGRRRVSGVNFLHLLSDILTAVASLTTVYLHKWLLRRSLETNAERPSYLNRTLRRSGLSLCAGWYLLMSRLLALGDGSSGSGPILINICEYICFNMIMWPLLYRHFRHRLEGTLIIWSNKPKTYACIVRVGFWHLQCRHVHNCDFEPSACTVTFENVNKTGITRW